MIDQIVTNSTCLIVLDRIGQLDLLKQVFPKLFAPPIVLVEVGIQLEWLIIEPIHDIKIVTALKTQLDEGESYAIALAMELGNLPIILDDKKARRIAKQLGLQVIGTLGVLLRAKQKGVVTEISPFLNALRHAGFYMTDDLYLETLRIAGELQHL
jgi:predicted nucleic acid-binding protein